MRSTLIKQYYLFYLKKNQLFPDEPEEFGFSIMASLGKEEEVVALYLLEFGTYVRRPE